MSAAAADPVWRVGLIGYGAIGQSVARLLLAQPGHALGIVTRSVPEDGFGPGTEALGDLEALLDWRPDAVIEAASAEAFAAFAPACLEAGIDVVAASVGALQDAALHERIKRLCDRTGSRLVVPSGAVGGIDHIAAAALHPETRVTYISRKPPAAWVAELATLGLSEASQKGPVTLFEGDAREAAARYPKNLNAGLTIALAAGFERTSVQVLADPAATGNTHEIRIEGPLGDSAMRFCNAPDPANPKTSAITAYSLIAATLRHFGTLQ
ncbi:aspartate dehydrogenase [Salipiger thiooxidans]|uniref:aspartate dehydrogenase n=1 Tax=Salipiger thiooxidans TaxID=282683 RepID=UPI001CD3437A|nr:aspartate dehydrogenase [Salipiger thiooxidans]MCA0848782.1 aspartate dehydrogenase [Salipiger thiooxidans]